MTNDNTRLNPPTDTSTSALAVPAAVPAAQLPIMASALASAPLLDSLVKTTPASVKPGMPERRSRTLGKHQLARRDAALSDRDRLVLHQLAEHRYLDTHQLSALVFAGHATTATAQRVCRRTLTRLERHGLIRPLGRMVGGVRGGSTVGVWQLSATGGRLVFSAAAGRYRPHEPSPRTLHHCLAVADAHLGLRTLVDQPGVVDVSVQLEPTCWRSYSGIGGERRSLQPDLATVIRGIDTAGEFEDRWFIEVDMATESVATLLKKCQQYQDYRQSGIEQANYDGVFPLVLWIMHGPRAEERISQLRAKIQRSQTLEPALYRFATARDLDQALLGDVE